MKKVFKNTVLTIVVVIMLFGVIAFSGCNDNNSELLHQLAYLQARVDALEADNVALQVEINRLQEEIDYLRFGPGPWKEVSFRVRAAIGNHVLPYFFDYDLYAKTRPSKREYHAFESLERNSALYTTQQSTFDFALITSREELNEVLARWSTSPGFSISDDFFGHPPISIEQCIVVRHWQQLYDKDFFEKNVLILYNWIVQGLGTFSYIDKIEVRNNTLRVVVAQYLNSTSVGSSEICRLAIEVCRTSVPYIIMAEITKSIYIGRPETGLHGGNDGFFGLPLYQDPHLTTRW